MTEQEKKELAARLDQIDEPGNKKYTGAYLSYSRGYWEVVGFEVTCDKPGCNCTGRWIQGSDQYDRYIPYHELVEKV